MGDFAIKDILYSKSAILVLFKLILRFVKLHDFKETILEFISSMVNKYLQLMQSPVPMSQYSNLVVRSNNKTVLTQRNAKTQLNTSNSPHYDSRVPNNFSQQ